MATNTEKAQHAPNDRDLHAALEREDPLVLARIASDDDLRRIRRAEQVLELRHDRKQRNARLAQFAQQVVGLVALLGFFANAYQTYQNKKDSEAQQKIEKERWEKEFKRAQDADKYRAFFETSALATDPSNPDKRLVGYALLKEFVDDKTYNAKAIIMLEESLALELRADTSEHGLDEQRRLAVIAILDALSHTDDCKALVQASRTVQKLAKPRFVKMKGAAEAAAAERDLDELAEVYALYVRNLVGRAATICTNPKDFREVRRPIRDALVALPALAGDASLKAPLKPADAIKHIARIIHENCVQEREAGAVTDCPEVEKGYAKLCVEMKGLTDWSDEAAGCEIMAAAAATGTPNNTPPVK